MVVGPRTPIFKEDTPTGFSHRPQEAELDSSTFLFNGLSYFADNGNSSISGTSNIPCVSIILFLKVSFLDNFKKNFLG